MSLYKQGYITVPALLNDAKCALQCGALFSGLCLIFALADECATKEWNKTHEDQRIFADAKVYAEWYQKCDITRTPKERRSNNGQAPQIDGELLYKLRCNVLHALSSNVDFSKMNDDANRNIKELDFYTDFYQEGCWSSQSCSYDKYKNNTLSVGVSGLAHELLCLIEHYYDNHKSDIDFNYIKITDFTSLYL